MQGAMGGRGLFGRALSGGALTAGSYAISQALRLASNLVLTRLLFPEAFGVMALVSVVLIGLAMFSDTGIGPAISRSARGDERGFLDTAWTINVVRGLLLWLVTCAVAWPVARFYAAPELAQLLPAAGLTLLIAGFNPTRIDTANRHLMLGRLTALDLLSQAIGILAMVILAAAMRSVWALVIGALIGSGAKLVLCWLFLPGEANRFAWDRASGRELLHFGKWIVLSSACGFLLSQGDKAVLGAHLSLADLGIYNIGYFLASFPMLLAAAVVSRIMIPLYRDHPPAASAQNAARLARLRRAISVAVLAMLAAMAVAGGPLVALMYDARYHTAGILVTAIAMAQMPAVVGLTYEHSALAAGDGRGFFLLQAARATVQTLAFLIGVQLGGLGGALAAQGLALTLVHPLIARLAWRHGAWDMRHDAQMFALVVALIVALAMAYGPEMLELVT